MTEHTLRISDHALVRYLERTGRINRAAVEREMLTPSVLAAAAEAADTGNAVMVDDPWTRLTVVVAADNTVVSVWPPRKKKP